MSYFWKHFFNQTWWYCYDCLWSSSWCSMRILSSICKVSISESMKKERTKIIFTSVLSQPYSAWYQAWIPGCVHTSRLRSTWGSRGGKRTRRGARMVRWRDRVPILAMRPYHPWGQGPQFTSCGAVESLVGIRCQFHNRYIYIYNTSIHEWTPGTYTAVHHLAGSLRFIRASVADSSPATGHGPNILGRTAPDCWPSLRPQSSASDTK